MWALCMAALAIISITHWVYRWRNPKCHGKLPPGSMGLPLLGETIQFFTANTSSDIPPFIQKRMEKKRAIGMLKDMLRERRGKSRDQPNDFFDYVNEELKKEGTILTEEISLDLMFALLFASFETTSIAMTLAIKFLSDHPLAL
ncbi:hypothetical protein ACE6H2_017170 [Prunus campanulata]